jgi:hypothetical protein
MKQIHATTSAAETYFRMLALLVLSLAAAFFIPPLPVSDALQSFLQTHVTNAGLLYAILLGFLLYITLVRKQAIEEAFSLELNKTRRIYHLALHLQKVEPKLRPWFEEVSAALQAYHAFFQTADFGHHAEGDRLYRNITYKIYELPQLGIPYNSELYSALLDTASSVTEARELVNDKLTEKIGRFAWMVMILITLVFCLVVVLATPDLFAARAISALVIFMLFLALQFLYEYDHSNRLKNKYIAMLYADNLKKTLSTTNAVNRKK